MFGGYLMPPPTTNTKNNPWVVFLVLPPTTNTSSSSPTPLGLLIPAGSSSHEQEKHVLRHVFPVRGFHHHTLGGFLTPPYVEHQEHALGVCSWCSMASSPPPSRRTEKTRPYEHVFTVRRLPFHPNTRNATFGRVSGVRLLPLTPPYVGLFLVFYSFLTPPFDGSPSTPTPETRHLVVFWVFAGSPSPPLVLRLPHPTLHGVRRLPFHPNTRNVMFALRFGCSLVPPSWLPSFAPPNTKNVMFCHIFCAGRLPSLPPKTPPFSISCIYFI